jgi:hypothetical protein
MNKLAHWAVCSIKSPGLWLFLLLMLALGSAGYVFITLGLVLFGGVLASSAITLLVIGVSILVLRCDSFSRRPHDVMTPHIEPCPPRHSMYCQDILHTAYSLCEHRTLHSVLARDAQRRVDEISHDLVANRLTPCCID